MAKRKRKSAKKLKQNREREDERSQCQCLGSDSSLFKGPSETCTGCPSAGAVSMQSDALVVCLSVSLSLSGWLKSEFSYWQVHLDIMNNFNPLNAGMKRKQPCLGIQLLSVRLVLSAWSVCVCVCDKQRECEHITA